MFELFDILLLVHTRAICGNHVLQALDLLLVLTALDLLLDALNLRDSLR